MSARKTPAATTWSNEAPAAARMAPIFLKTWCVCASIPPDTRLPVDGSLGICPDRNSRFPALIAWEYGPIAAGAFGVETAWRTLRGLDDLAGPQAARADAHPLDAAVDHRADALKVRLEPARAHVVRVADVPPDDRALSADFAALRHDVYSLFDRDKHRIIPYGPTRIPPHGGSSGARSARADAPAASGRVFGSRLLGRGPPAARRPGAREPRARDAQGADAGGAGPGHESTQRHAPRGGGPSPGRNRAVAGARRRRRRPGARARALRRPGASRTRGGGRPRFSGPAEFPRRAAAARGRGVPRAGTTARAADADGRRRSDDEAPARGGVRVDPGDRAAAEQLAAVRGSDRAAPAARRGPGAP